jgi:hypothetical protein
MQLEQQASVQLTSPAQLAHDGRAIRKDDVVYYERKECAGRYFSDH